jgi:hypothetical protein
MRILGIDPGPEHSAYVLWESGSVRDAGFIDNEALRHYLRSIEVRESDQCAIETITGYGMPVGKETFGTCIWIGIFQECWSRRSEHRAILVPRKEIKLHHCHSSRAKDANVRQALLDKYGRPGTKKRPGATYGLSGHLWAAFAVATYVTEREIEDSSSLSTQEKGIII